MYKKTKCKFLYVGADGVSIQINPHYASVADYCLNPNLRKVTVASSAGFT